jgi:hypothetical protein
MNDTIDNVNDSKSIKMGVSAVAGDWINRIMAAFANVELEAAVVAVAADPVTDTAAVIGRKAKFGLDDGVLNELASQNSMALKETYPNIGMKRMALSNKLRAAAKRRGGLYIPTGTGSYGWQEAPADFETSGTATETPHGVKIAPVKAVAEEAEAA